MRTKKNPFPEKFDDNPPTPSLYKLIRQLQPNLVLENRWCPSPAVSVPCSSMSCPHDESILRSITHALPDPVHFVDPNARRFYPKLVYRIAPTKSEISYILTMMRKALSVILTSE